MTGKGEGGGEEMTTCTDMITHILGFKAGMKLGEGLEFLQQDL